ncbi:MAG: hypothetical protein EXR72_26085 [Myxococcales bacterium]|nr:hypothetical protein [Myxococcales bacterium]
MNQLTFDQAQRLTRCTSIRIVRIVPASGTPRTAPRASFPRLDRAIENMRGGNLQDVAALAATLSGLAVSIVALW